jgi:hypothetical protein
MLNQYQKISRAFFLNQTGEPFDLTVGQSEIFRLIYEPSIIRGAIRAVTQYGKSDVASQASIISMVERYEKILVVSPSAKQSSIIMGYLIGHLFDHPYITKMIEYEGSLEKLRQERSKSRITFKNGSEFFILTADVNTISQEARNLMGFGATVVLVDESPLIPDNMFSKILRMIGGYDRGKLIQLGNPFVRNHFYRAFYSNRYEKIIIKYPQAVAEGRLTQEFIDEAKEEMPPMDFMVFYDCEFPEMGSEDSLIPYDWIMMAVDNQVEEGDIGQSGLDVARFGKDLSAYCYRKGGVIKRLSTIQGADTMAVAGWCSKFYDDDSPEYLSVDVVGLGAGVYDRLRELGYEVRPINVGESPSGVEQKEKFYNLRAEIFWNLREMMKPVDGKSRVSFPNDPDLIRQLSELRYKYSSEKKIRMEDKDDMKKRIGKSPDKADAVALAFYDLTDSSPSIMIV